MSWYKKLKKVLTNKNKAKVVKNMNEKRKLQESGAGSAQRGMSLREQMKRNAVKGTGSN